jgi:polysaccharide biosynthesis/export protein
MTLRRLLPVLLIAPALLAATQVPSKQQTPPDKPPQAQKTLPNTVGADSTAAPIDPKTYLMGPEDVLYVNVFDQPLLTGAVAVRPDGKITRPLIGDMQAAGLTPENLSAHLKQALSTLVKNPDVTITVAQVNSKRYMMAGEVQKPGPFPLVLPTRVFDALNMAGFRDFANTSRIVIIRDNKRIKFNYKDVLRGKKLAQNIYLEPGDTIYVP